MSSTHPNPIISVAILALAVAPEQVISTVGGQSGFPHEQKMSPPPSKRGSPTPPMKARRTNRHKNFGYMRAKRGFN
jgi:hypothetical protein